MKLSTKGRYAVAALFDLMCSGSGQPVSVREISKRQVLSSTYLEQLLLKLKRAGLIKTVRGPKGGYQLAKKPSQITIGDIIRATEGPIALSHCSSGRKCKRAKFCSTQSLWRELTKKVAKVLDSTSLEDIKRSVC